MLRTDDVVFIGFLIAGIGMLTAVVTRQQKVEERRLGVVEAALQRPELDPALRQQLIDALSKRSRPSQLMAKAMTWMFWQRALFAVGWFLFVVSGGALALGFVGIIRAPNPEVAIVMLTGLAMMSLPRALEELRRRGDRLAAPR
ncbi:MAG: hypothetical protein H6835_14205 [Planctomycetes bacterium]|nr:hypothetical protein [Planctomycetota bacterium]